MINNQVPASIMASQIKAIALLILFCELLIINTSSCNDHQPRGNLNEILAEILAVQRANEAAQEGCDKIKVTLMDFGYQVADVWTTFDSGSMQAYLEFNSNLTVLQQEAEEKNANLYNCLLPWMQSVVKLDESSKRKIYDDIEAFTKPHMSTLSDIVTDILKMQRRIDQLNINAFTCTTDACRLELLPEIEETKTYILGHINEDIEKLADNLKRGQAIIEYAYSQVAEYLTDYHLTGQEFLTCANETLENA